MPVRADDRGYLLRGNLYIVLSGAVENPRDGNRAAARGELGQVAVVHSEKGISVGGVPFDDDSVRGLEKLDGISARRGQPNLAIARNVCRFDNRCRRFRQESASNEPSHRAEMRVGVENVSAVDGVPQVPVRLVWRSPADRACPGEFPVAFVACRGSRKERNLKGVSRIVDSFRALCESGRNLFRVAGERESGNAEDFPVLDEIRGFLGGHFLGCNVRSHAIKLGFYVPGW